MTDTLINSTYSISTTFSNGFDADQEKTILSIFSEQGSISLIMNNSAVKRMVALLNASIVEIDNTSTNED